MKPITTDEFVELINESKAALYKISDAISKRGVTCHPDYAIEKLEIVLKTVKYIKAQTRMNKNQFSKELSSGK